MTKHTPGPWKADPIYLGDSPKICAHRLFGGERGGSFATIENKTVTGLRLPNTEAAANARLIAAAPELLEALKGLVGAHLATPGGPRGVMLDIPHFIDKANAAITKAEGR